MAKAPPFTKKAAPKGKPPTGKEEGADDSKLPPWLKKGKEKKGKK